MARVADSMLELATALAALAAAFAVMFGAWLVSLRLRDASVADIAWGLCFVAIAWTVLAIGPAGDGRSVLIAVLVSVWGLRLAAYITSRHDSEDRRYRAMRSKHGERFALRSLLTVFALQAVIAWVVSLPIQVSAVDATPDSIGLLGIAGALICGVGIALETIADLQLSRFLRREDSTQRVMDGGLWRFSRHPNYFGDAVFWWGVWLIALETGSAWWTAIGPAVMTLLLLRVSGVALTEKTISERRPGYRDYEERTSAFIPLPPRH